MNQQQIPKALKDGVGKLQEIAVKIPGSTDQQTALIQRQLVGRVDKRNGDARLAHK